MGKMKFVLVYVFVLVCLIPLYDQVKTKSLESRIDQVTVYQNRALVKRVARSYFESGLYTLQFEHLPMSMKNDSVRVAGRGKATALILNVRVEQKYLEKAFQKSSEELERLKKQLNKENKELKGQLQALGKRETFFQDLTSKKMEALAKEKNPKLFVKDEWQGMLDFYEAQLKDIYSRRLSLGEKIRDKEVKLAVVGAQLSQNRSGQRKLEKMVLVDIKVKKKGNLEVETSYLVPNASWNATYDLRLNSGDHTGSLMYSAHVRQQSGEDWHNARLTLSTAQPMQIEDIPRLTPIIIEIFEKEGRGRICGQVQTVDGEPLPGVAVILSAYDTSIKKRSVSNENGHFCFHDMTAGNYQMVYDLEGFNRTTLRNIRLRSGQALYLNTQMELGTITKEIVLEGKTAVVESMKKSAGVYMDRANVQSLPTGKDLFKIMELAAAQVTVKGISTSFQVSHRSTVKSGKSRKVTIMVQNLKVKKELIAVPKLSEKVLLRAKIKNQSDSPFLAGEVKLFYDGAFINTTSIPLVIAGEGFELPVGVEEAIRIKRELLKTESEKKRFWGNKQLEHNGYKITLENLRQETVDLIVLDQIPVSKEKKVKIEIKDIEPKPVKEKEAEKNGLLKWKINLKAKGKKVIKVKYILEYPKGILVKEVNQGELY